MGAEQANSTPSSPAARVAPLAALLMRQEPDGSELRAFGIAMGAAAIFGVLLMVCARWILP